MTLEVAHEAWKLGEAVDGHVEFATAGQLEAVISGAGSEHQAGFIKFRFEQVGGVSVEPTWPLDCESYTIRPDEPLISPMRKSGTYDRNEPGWEFYYNFLKDPLLRLPSGTWRISALAWFYDGAGCEAASHRLTATVEIEVSE